MSIKRGDVVRVTQGDFAGQVGTVSDKDLIGDGLTVALAGDGKQVETHEGHVEPAEGGGANVGDGDRVIIQQGSFKGEVGTVLTTDVVGDGVDVRLDDKGGKVVRTEEAHLGRFRDR